MGERRIFETGFVCSTFTVPIGLRHAFRADRSVCGPGVSHSVAIRHRTVKACAASEEKESAGESDQGYSRMQGPSPAPTTAGVSTAGLEEGEAAFLEACYVADVSAIEKALSAVADVNVRDVNQRTALHFCAGNGLGTMVRRLAELGADLNIQDILGLTPLHMATGYKKPDTVEALIELGADANKTCYGGELPVELAERILRATPERRFMLPNAEYQKVKRIAEALDEVTEVEEDDEADGADGADEGDKLAHTSSSDTQATHQSPQISEGADGTKFVVRVKEKRGGSTSDDKATSSTKNIDAKVSVTVRSKKSEQIHDSQGTSSESTSTVSTDASFVVRPPGKRD